MPATEPRQLWGGRFARLPDPSLLQLTTSIEEDMRLLEFDLQATRAHARVLAAAGLLHDDALGQIDETCESLLDRWRRGELSTESHEDVHSLVEHHLTDTLGDIGRQIHAGRSRNDLVATDLRLWARSQVFEILDQLGALITELAARAEEHASTLMPSYTHLQRAQPVSLGFHLA
ncbi:MAG: lyase family protein, partial [Actinomycetota bacterium]